MEAPQRSGEDQWVCLYPVYVDAASSLSKGRKVPKGCAVADPTVAHLAKAVEAIPLQYKVELRKRHPQSPFSNGRIRVQLYNEDGSPVKAGLATRQALFRHCGTTVTAIKAQAENAKAKSTSTAAAPKGAPISRKKKKKAKNKKK